MKRALLLVMACLVIVPFVGAQGVQIKGSNTVSFAPNNVGVGTIQWRLAKIVAGEAVVAAITDTGIALYPVSSTTSISGDAVYVTSGPTVCEMDALNASGMSNKPVVASVLVAGRCHPQAALPAAGYVLGYMIDDSTTVGGVARMNVSIAPSFPAAGTASGTVTNAALTMPAEFSVAGSPITTAGTFAITKANQTANLAWLGPASGGAAQPTFRAQVAADIAAALAGTTAGGSLGGTYPNPTVVNAPGAFAFTGDIRPTTLPGNADNYTPTNGAINTVWYLDGGALDRTISGLYVGSDGEIKVLTNVGLTFGITLLNQSTATAAAGRFLFGVAGSGGDVYLGPGESQAIVYDTTGQRWKPFGAVMLDAARIKVCGFGVGSPSASAAPIAADDAITNACPNDFTRDLEILTVSCLANNTGVVVTPILTGGTTTSILTGGMTCGNGSWADGTVQTAKPVLHSFSGTGSTCTTPSCSLAASWTTTGLATELQVKIKMRLR